MLIYIYLAVCLGMTGFNLAYMMIFTRRRKGIPSGRRMEKAVLSELDLLSHGGHVRQSHRRMLRYRLRKALNLRIFNTVLERVYPVNPDIVRKYLLQNADTAVLLAKRCNRSDPVSLAYIAHTYAKYSVLYNNLNLPLLEMFFSMLSEDSIYCRVNAMQAICSSGSTEFVIKALHILDRGELFYHGKILADGLLHFSGNEVELADIIVAQHDTFSLPMQIKLLDYVSIISGRYSERMLMLLKNEESDDELRFSALRYLGRNPFLPAYDYIIGLAESKPGMRWEYQSIACTVLASYPHELTRKVLKKALSSSNWYVRKNAAKTLGRLCRYSELLELIRCEDPFARDAVQYIIDLRRIQTVPGEIIR